MIKKILAFIIVLLVIFCATGVKEVKASELTDNVYQQLGNLDLTELENYFNSSKLPESLDFYSLINNIILGSNNISTNEFSSYILSVIFKSVEDFLPSLIMVLIIVLLCSWMRNLRSSFMDNGINNMVVYVCILSAVGVLIGHIITIYKNTIIVIDNIAKLCEIMSPIILSLMVASGATVSVGVYKPAVAVFSGGIINVVLTFILPIISLIIMLSFFNSISFEVRFNKFIDFFGSMIKWFFGIVTTVFGAFVTLQGITSATFDGISIKTAKYALSNSIPLIGGFVRDGLDLVVAGSVIIKNTIGIIGVFNLFYIVLSPVLQILVFILLLKAFSAVIEPIADERVSGFLTSISKGLTYVNVCLIMVGMMFFMMLLLMIISANAFI